MITWLSADAALVLALPVIALVLQAIPSWFGRPWGEAVTAGIVRWAFSLSFLAALAAGVGLLAGDVQEVRMPLGMWFSVSAYRFHWVVVLDGLSVPFAALGTGLIGLIGAFSRRYVHRDPGFNRFHLLITLLGAGITTVFMAGSLDCLVLGWEWVGVASALLIAFFHERLRPVQHGLQAFITYRVCDLGLLGAAVWLHHAVGDTLMTPISGAWDGLPVPAGTLAATAVGLLLLFAVMGKSAQVPFSGWLPRAMEGPTPSSAVFYGALSIHLGPFLLLRAAPILDQAPIAAGAVVAVGVLTALHATVVGRVQTDIKSALAYASMTQVGLIVAEIGLGFRFLAVAHVVGHACIRTLQILRSPSLLHDHHHLEQAMGSLLPHPGGHLERMVPRPWQLRLYRHALERGYLDPVLKDRLVGGFVRAVRYLDFLERRWISLLAETPPAKPPAEHVPPYSEAH